MKHQQAHTHKKQKILTQKKYIAAPKGPSTKPSGKPSEHHQIDIKQPSNHHISKILTKNSNIHSPEKYLPKIIKTRSKTVRTPSNRY
jgi:hypothetical protein